MSVKGLTATSATASTPAAITQAELRFGPGGAGIASRSSAVCFCLRANSRRRLSSPRAIAQR